jgi:putative hydrolase of the HAD superfamily
MHAAGAGLFGRLKSPSGMAATCPAYSWNVDSSALPPRESIDAVIFDAGGVLLLPDGELGLSLLASLGCGPDGPDWRSVWRRAHYASMSFLDQLEKTDWPVVRRVMAEAAGVGPADLDAAVPLIEQVASTPWVAADGAAEVLRQLSAAGYQLAVVSNSGGSIASQLEAAGICSASPGELTKVAAVIDSFVVGIEKPDPRIFRFAIDALGVDPGRSVYVGDTVRFDVTGARAAGLHPVHVDPFGLCAAGDHGHIADVTELTAILAGP